jgi:hypothetical protein
MGRSTISTIVRYLQEDPHDIPPAQYGLVMGVVSFVTWIIFRSGLLFYFGDYNFPMIFLSGLVFGIVIGGTSAFVSHKF